MSADDAVAPFCLPPGLPKNERGLQLPEGSVDCHFHVLSEAAALAPARSYTPRPAPLAEWLRFAGMFGIARGVAVQPSVYGLDNSVLLDALAAAPERLHGVAVISPDLGDDDLAALDRQGVRAVRINLRNRSGLTLTEAEALLPRIKSLGWHLQFQVSPSDLPQVGALAVRHKASVVVDHFGFLSLDHPNATLAALQPLLDLPGVHVKLSAPYRLGKGDGGFAKVVRTLCASHTDKLLWGSDWPHTELFEQMPDGADLIAEALDAIPAAQRQAVFIDNPTALYWSH